MKRAFWILLLLIPGFLLKAQPVKVMLVTGGHSYDTIQFHQMFDELDGIQCEHFLQPKANEKLVDDLAKDFDVLVFYDMWKVISEKEKAAYLKLTKQGKPFLFMHHSIASYQNWPEFEKIFGGKYFEKSKDVPKKLHSTYKHDVWVDSKVVANHPATAGLSKMRFLDEIYGNVRISPNVTSLITTDHPESMKILAWENRYNESNIIYLQAGHDHHTYAEKDFRKLVEQSIKYLAKSK